MCKDMVSCRRARSPRVHSRFARPPLYTYSLCEYVYESIFSRFGSCIATWDLMVLILKRYGSHALPFNCSH